MAVNAEQFKTYDCDTCLGATAPSLANLDFVKGEKIDLEAGKIYVLYYFTTFYKGGWWCNDEMTKLSENMSDVIFIAVNLDAEKEKLEKFMGKTILDENTKVELRMQTPYVAYDPSRITAKMYAKTSGDDSLKTPHGFIVGKDGKIAWRQEFSQSHSVDQSNFEAQLQHLRKGEEVAKNGPRPVIEEEGEADECDGEMSLF